MKDLIVKPKKSKVWRILALVVLGVVVWLAVGGGRNPSGELLKTGERSDPTRSGDLTGSSPALEAFATSAFFWNANNPPIVFYGRVVDQTGNPVPDVEIRGGVLYGLMHKSGRQEAFTRSGADGRFEISGMEGFSLGLGLKKDGYEFVPFGTSFRYSLIGDDYHRPDANAPVDIVMWKQQGPENLIRYRQTWRFQANAEPLRINLESGGAGEADADLVVRVFRDPLRMPFAFQGFEWRVSVEVIGGGLLAVGARQYYNLAPEAGYLPKFERQQERQDWEDVDAGRIKWTWKENVEEVFFIKSRDGKNHARVKLSIRPNADRKEGDNEAVVTADVWLNPNGSRNLEYDRNKAIMPPGTDYGL